MFNRTRLPSRQFRTMGPQSDNETKPRRRAPRACLTCRARKVRCDVIERWPCGNCQWTSCECIVASHKDRLGRYFRIKPPGSSKHDGENGELLRPDQIGHSNRHQSVSSSENTENGPLSLYALADMDFSQDSCCSPPNDLAGRSLPADSVDQSPWNDSSLATEEQEQPLAEERPTALEEIDLESFIAPVPGRMQTDDIAYLKSRGAFTLPGHRLRNALLRSYFEYVHPFMPIVDIDEFLEAIRRDGKHTRLSLLLYQSIMFAGVACVHMDYLKGLGFNSRKKARKEFFHRVRLLYDFNYETDRLVLVQSALLMTLWYDSPEEHRNTWHWVDVAVSQAFATGLHLDLHDPLLSVRQCTLRRKIWWSCYVTDRLVSLYMKRPPRIRDDDFHVLILEDSDFETTLPPQGYHNPLQAMCRYVLDRKIRITLGKLFIEYVGLCQIMDSFLQSYRCKGLGIENQWLSNSYMHGFSNDQLGSGQLHLLLQQKMTNWRESLPNCCRYKAPSSIESISAIAVHHTVLHMLFQALMLLTHRSTLSVSQHGPNCTADEEEANVGILDAAIRISHMAGEVHETGLDSFLPASSLSAVLPAIAVLLQKVGDGEQRQISICKEGFIRCLEVITVMENIYEPARLARDAITWAIPESYHDDYPFDMEEASPMDLFTPYGETEISIENVAEISSEYNYSGSTDYTSPTTSQRSADMEPVEELCTGWIDSEFSMQLEPLATSKGLSSCKENMYSMEGLGVLNDLSLPLEWEGVYSSF